MFFMAQSADHVSGLTGASPVVYASKAGASGVSVSGAISQVDSSNLPGWYKVAGNATDTNTLGPLVLHATAGSGDPTDVEFAVVAIDPQVATNLGLSALPTATAAAAGGLMVTGASNAGTTTFAGGISGTITGNLGGSITGSVASVTGNVGGNVTGSVGSVAGNVTGNVAGDVVGNVQGNVAGTVAFCNSVTSLAGNAISASSIQSGAITAAKFAASAIDSAALADNITFTGVVIGGTDVGTAATRFLTMISLDGSVYHYTANALELAPGGGGGGGTENSYVSDIQVTISDD